MKLLKLILLSFLLISCDSHNKDKTYDDYLEFHCLWHEIFLKDDASYFVYFYSQTCPHCERIKNEIFAYIDQKTKPLYLVVKSGAMVFTKDISKTIGVDKIEAFSIYAFPSLVHIHDGLVLFNEYGANNISNIISSM
ncbi:MAG: hypothetical protein LBR37_01150 [Erysipelotrichaceae bacterium]|nr:hypothetical protein [Erysipelotrichaceae bacterium]